MAARLRTIKVYQQKILDLLGLRLLSNEMAPLLNEYYKKELKFIKSTARLLERELINRRGTVGLCRSKGIRATSVKVGGKKKVCRLAQLEPDAGSEAEQQNFFETFNFGCW